MYITQYICIYITQSFREVQSYDMPSYKAV